jgi:hypothetical protein
MEINPEYINLNELWNDRRSPHANPLSTDPRRTAARSSATNSLDSLLHFLYRPGVARESTSEYSK